MEDKLLKALRDLKEKKTYARYLFLDEILQENQIGHELKVAVLRNYTTEMLTPVIAGEIASINYMPRIQMGDYDNIQQEVLVEESNLYKFEPDIIILAIWLEHLSPKLCKEFNALTREQIEQEKERIISEVCAMISTIRQKSSAMILLNNFIYPSNSSMGILDLQMNNSQLQVISELNRRLYEVAHAQTNTYIVDFVSVFYKLGYDNAFDSKTWAISKNPFTKLALVHVGIEYGKYIKTLLGKSKKCIVLDCDNTLWGGLVGELGPYDIKIGENYPGICYENLQREVLNLYYRGIMVVLCSKNNEADVLEALQKNKEMIIKENHLATYQINWKDKASNIREIAEFLNIGLDSLVFVDDSEFECNLVKSQIPEIEVIHLNGDPSKYASLIRDCGLFNSLVLTEDDKKRNQNYRTEFIRKEIKKGASSIEEYLASLEMQVTVKTDCFEDINRIAQLTQKTNQFNLTTKRYNEEQIKKFMLNEDYEVIDINLEDKISDLGIIGVAILHFACESVEVDTFLLSCRAIGRNIEDALFKVGMENAHRRRCKFVYGRYNKTKKNEQVATFYKKYGVPQIEQDEEANTIWQGLIPTIQVADYIKVVIK